MDSQKLSGMRYARNKPVVSDKEQALLKSCTAAIVGLGGLGGNIAEQMARLGFGKLILIDGDVLESTNLNRQLFAVEDNIGVNKTEAALTRLRAVNSESEYIAHTARLDESNAIELLTGADIVMDGLDNITSRRVLCKACVSMGIPLVHGAIGAWYGQVSFIMPGDDTLDILYPPGIERIEPVGNPSFTPALVASLQVSQAVKWRLAKDGLLIKQVLYIDLLNQNFDTICLE